MDVDSTEFLEFVVTADVEKVEYILIGGLALILNGAIRFTQDADIWLRPTNENRDRFLKAISPFGYEDSDIESMRSIDLHSPRS